MPIKPITGMLRRGLVLDLSVALGMLILVLVRDLRQLPQIFHGIEIY